MADHSVIESRTSCFSGLIDSVFSSMQLSHLVCVVNGEDDIEGMSSH